MVDDHDVDDEPTDIPIDLHSQNRGGIRVDGTAAPKPIRAKLFAADIHIVLRFGHYGMSRSGASCLVSKLTRGSVSSRGQLDERSAERLHEERPLKQRAVHVVLGFG